MSAAEVVAADYSVKACDEIAATIAGLEAIAAWSKAHPDIPLTQSGVVWIVARHRARHLTTEHIVRAITDGARIGDVRKEPGVSQTAVLFVERDFGGRIKVQLQADRDEVCERVVTGTETVTIPDPAAPLVEVEREVVEWRCAPILGSAGTSEAAPVGKPESEVVDLMAALRDSVNAARAARTSGGGA